MFPKSTNNTLARLERGGVVGITWRQSLTTATANLNLDSEHNSRRSLSLSPYLSHAIKCALLDCVHNGRSRHDGVGSCWRIVFVGESQHALQLRDGVLLQILVSAHVDRWRQFTSATRVRGT
jgi:hypothetical protein